MATKVVTTRELIPRLRALGLNKSLSTAIAEQFVQWIEASREEWTIKRLKELKVDLIRHLGGLPPVATWIERRKDKVTPKGPFGALWALAKTKPFSALNAVNIYTWLILQRGDPRGDITPAQAQSLVEAVHRPAPSKEAELVFDQLMDHLAIKFVGDPPAFESEEVIDVPIRPNKRVPIIGRGMVKKEHAFPRSLTILSLNPVFYWKHQRLLDSTLGSISGLVPIRGDTESVRITDDQPIPVILNNMVLAQARKDKGLLLSPSDAIVGELRFIQDSGFKLRHIFVTNELVQLASLPLQAYLMNQLRHIKQDCTYQQDAGVEYTQSMLRQGYTAFCFDLTKCSDNLPRSFQIKMFRLLGLPEPWIEWFSDVCSSLWELHARLPIRFQDGSVNSWVPAHAPYSHKTQKWIQVDDRIRMRVGQELGFGPSFPAFALLHHAIVASLFKRRNLRPLYRILGDDVVIFDPDVASDYEKMMSLFGVPISTTKTIVSNRIAEFAGRVIMPNRVIVTYKWRGRHSDNNFLDLARNLGPKSVSLFRPRQRFIAEVLGWIPEPLGLGWNPEGKSWQARMDEFRELVDLLEMEKDIRVRHYQRRASRVNRMIYDFPEWTRGLSAQEQSSDQEDITRLVSALSPSPALGKFIQNFRSGWEVFLPNLDYLARSPDIGGLTGHEINGLLSRYSWIEKLSKISQLTIYERKLGFSREKRRS